MMMDGLTLLFSLMQRNVTGRAAAVEAVAQAVTQA